MRRGLGRDQGQRTGRDLRLLQQTAADCGIQTSYIDMAGQRRECAPEVLANVIKCFRGTDSAEELPAELKCREPKIEPVLVAWEGKLRSLRVTKRSLVELRLENGGQLDLSRGGPTPRLPPGYHKLLTAGEGWQHETLVVSAPSRSYSDPAHHRSWGVFCPMYALHSRRYPGVGHFGTWRDFVDWLHVVGASVVATLPLLAAFLGEPVCEPSPYSPASRFFWNELYLDLGTRMPGVSPGSLIEYASEAKRRRRVLENEAKRFFANTGTSRFREFLRFLREHPHLENYSRFRATCESTRKPWHCWPERMRSGQLLPTDYREADKNYHAYAQWLAHQQMASLLGHCQKRGIKFYLDLPLGVHPDGYDVWRERESFALEASAGAPPDPCFSRGQDWGFPPLHPQRLRETKYRYFVEYIRFQMRHTGMLRIDHVMGLHRLYWIPKGCPATEGAYVSYRSDELYAILCLESHRNKTVLVGENLGTVPAEVNDAMARTHLRRTYVAQYELQPKPRKALPRPPRESVASLNTHDMPPFAAFLRGNDIRDRQELGLIRKGTLRSERESRKRVVLALSRFLKAPAAARPLVEASLQWLAASPAETVLINLEDLWLEALPQNVPGTCTERPNWRRQTRLSLDEIRTKNEIAAVLREIAATRKRS